MPAAKKTRESKRRTPTGHSELPSESELRELLYWVTKRAMEYLYFKEAYPDLYAAPPPSGQPTGWRADAHALRLMLDVMRDSDVDGALAKAKNGVLVRRKQRRIVIALAVLTRCFHAERGAHLALQDSTRRLQGDGTLSGPTSDAVAARLWALRESEIEFKEGGIEEKVITTHPYDPGLTPEENAAALVRRLFSWAEDTQNQWSKALRPLLEQVKGSLESQSYVLGCDVRNLQFGFLTIPDAFMVSFLARFVCGATEHFAAHWLTLLGDHLDHVNAKPQANAGARRKGERHAVARGTDGYPFLGNGDFVTWVRGETANPDGPDFVGKPWSEDGPDALLKLLHTPPRKAGFWSHPNRIISEEPLYPQPLDRP